MVVPDLVRKLRKDSGFEGLSKRFLVPDLTECMARKVASMYLPTFRDSIAAV